MSAISFTIPVEPMSLQTSGKRMMIRNGKPLFFKSSKATAYQKEIVLRSRQYRPGAPLEGALRVDFKFILPRPCALRRAKDPEGLIPCHKRPDRDNLQKGTQDALGMAGFWKDDGQIFDGRVSKFYAEKSGQPRIEVTIEEVEV